MEETIYQRIKRLRLTNKMTQQELAKAVGYTNKSSIGKVQTGLVDLTQSRVVAFASALGVSPSYLVWGQEAEESLPLTRIPVLGAIACGNPIEAIENHDEYIQYVGKSKADFALICSGDSMVPTIMNGDYVLIRQQNDVNDGQIAAVVIDGQATLKHIYHTAAGLLLTADNPSYPPRLVQSEDIRINGLAVSFQRSLTQE